MANELLSLQSQLDTIKYYRSEKEGCDLSGKMDYCHNCPYKFWDSQLQDYKCLASQDSKASNFLCATNYLLLDKK